MDAVQYVRDLIAEGRRQDGFCLGVLVPKAVYEAIYSVGYVVCYYNQRHSFLVLDGVRIGLILDG